MDAETRAKVLAARPSLEDLHKRTAEQIELAEEIQKADPKLPMMSAIVIAGDRLTARDADAALAAGASLWSASALIGSYAILDWVVSKIEAGVVPESELYPRLPDLWRGSDPDDTDPRYFWLWYRAWSQNGRRTIHDSEIIKLPAPRPGQKRIRVYRGQDPDVLPGIAWTTDREIARGFAAGRATRQANRGGIIYKAYIDPEDVFAYLTMRGEFETVLNPWKLRTTPGKANAT